MSRVSIKTVQRATPIAPSQAIGWGVAGALGLMTAFIGLHALPGMANGRTVQVQQVRGNVTYRGSQTRAARVGDRLSSVGQGVSTAGRSSAVLTVDEAIGSVQVAENTDVRLTQLQTTPDGARITLFNVPRGQVRLQVRRFTNPNSRLEVQTPSGVASVRGTEFGVNVSSAGVTGIATLEGAVAATAVGQTVDIPANFASAIPPGEPPIPPVLLDRELEFNIRRISRSGNELTIFGSVNPTNSVYFSGEDIPVNVDGSVTIRTSLSVTQPRIVVVVQNPLGEQKSQRLQMRAID